MMRRLSVLLIPLVMISACTTPPVKKPPLEKPVVQKPVVRTDVLAQLASDASPERSVVRDRYRFDRSITMGRIPGVRLYTYQPADEKREKVVGFSLTDKGSERINRRGLRGTGSSREFLFQFPDRAREEIALLVSDDVALSGRYSHDNMFRELYFFPRRQLPSLRRKGGYFEVRLPTGEPVLFDVDTGEVVDGVLREQPIDFNSDRHARRNPRIDYQGQGLVITVAQRGEAARRAVVWGRKKRAEIRYPARYKSSCYVSPALLWDQRPKKGDTDPRLTWRIKSDAEIFSLVENRCGWDLTELRKEDDIKSASGGI